MKLLHKHKTKTGALLLLALCILASVGADKVAMASSSFQLNGTVGQPGVGAGLVTSGSHQVGPGFWYGVSGEHKIYLPLVLRNH